MRTVRVGELAFNERTWIVLRSGKEVRPLEDPILLDAGWFIPCGFGFDDAAGVEHEEMIGIDEITMIRNPVPSLRTRLKGAYYDGDGDR